MFGKASRDALRWSGNAVVKPAAVQDNRNLGVRWPAYAVNSRPSVPNEPGGRNTVPQTELRQVLHS